jgi:hypothetical protein
MMKNGIFLLLCTVFVAACGSKSGSNSSSQNGTVATTGLNSCLNGNTTVNTQVCNTANYGQYSQYGFRAYNNTGLNPSRWNNQGYYSWSQARYSPSTYGVANYAAFCACAASTRPVYLPQGGVGCLESTYFQNFSGTAYYGLNSQNNFEYNAQFQNIQGYNYSGRSCYQAVARACTIGTNDCGGGLQCLPTTGGSPIGLCATGLTNNGYDYSGRSRSRGHYDDREDDHDERNDRHGRHGRDERNGGSYSSSGSISGGSNR